MNPRIRFGVTAARQTLAVVDLLLLPRSTPESTHTRRRSQIFRAVAIALALIRIVQAWRQMQRASRRGVPRRRAAQDRRRPKRKPRDS